ncbi:MAG: PAS domain S-box protein [Nitrospinae bacterium]|nr:PAS domain S-box protein [Nitrospinota bacterium]
MTQQSIAVLLVEDNPTDRMAFERHVREQSLPYRLRVVTNLGDARDLLARTKFDVVLLDFHLSDGDCLDLLPDLEAVPTIVVSGTGNESVAVKAMRMGAYDYLIKDPDNYYLALISSTIQKALRRKQTEINLAKSEYRYRTLVETAPDIIFQLDERKTITYINSAIDKLGYSPAELIGRPIAEFISVEEDGELLRIATKRKGERATKGLETRFKCRKGGFLWHEIAISLVALDSFGIWNSDFAPSNGSEDKFLGTHCVARDITERKRMEDQLGMFSRAVEQSPAPIMIANPDGDIEYVNPSFQKSCGYSAEELIGKNPRILKSGKHPPEFYRDLWDTILSGETWLGEFHNKRKNGEIIQELQSISPVTGSRGTITHLLSVKIDDPGRKKAEENLQRYARELERSNSELQDFAFIASHDLQEPLRKISAFGDRLVQMTSSMQDSQMKDFIERMQGASLRMQKLIDGLLLYSRVATKAQPFKLTDLNKVVANVLSDLEVRINIARARVETQPLPAVEADEGQMHQLFLNLINNAVKFHKKNEVPKVFISSRRLSPGENLVLDPLPPGPEGGPRTPNGLPEAEAAWEITVRDQGIGFEEKNLSRILKPFERLHGRSEYEGVGMGLAICNKIAAYHGGRLTARSRPREGSSFVVILPEKQKKEDAGF